MNAGLCAIPGKVISVAASHSSQPIWSNLLFMSNAFLRGDYSNANATNAVLVETIKAISMLMQPDLPGLDKNLLNSFGNFRGRDGTYRMFYDDWIEIVHAEHVLLKFGLAHKLSRDNNRRWNAAQFEMNGVANAARRARSAVPDGVKQISGCRAQAPLTPARLSTRQT